MTQSGNPFASIKRIETGQELIDIAFNKAVKIKPPSGRMDGLQRSRDHEVNRINTVANVLTSRIDRMVRDFPSFNLIHPFYLELASILVDIDKLRITLGRIYGLFSNIRELESQFIEELRNTNSKMENKKIRKRAFGRMASLIYQLNNQFENLEEMRVVLKPLPGFDPYIPSVVVAGVPNTGKSSFVRASTSGKPEIASYPFTTKRLIFGHRKFGFLSVQFIDTPGLLDRPIDQRNQIELQALTALKHLSDIMIFLIDPSSHASCTIEEQISLLHQIIDFYPSQQLIVAISKVDLVDAAKTQKIVKQLVEETIVSSPDAVIQFHSTEREGMSTLLDRIDKMLKQDVLSSSKFRAISHPEIAEDQLPLEDDLMWLTDQTDEL
jgi:nucleolar GTP-binding protein